jgi:hypothetical protein
MMRRFFSQRIIMGLLALILICALSVGFGMAQSSSPAPANGAKKRFFVNKAPAKSSPKEVSGASAPSAKNSENSDKKLGIQPASQIKIPPVRITIGGRDNRSVSLPPIRVSPQDIAKVQKIMELMNIGQKSGR